MDTETTIVEVNGVKMEIDLRHAKIVHQNIKVGTKVKILGKSSYETPTVYPGVVVGFEPFKELPTIIVAYLNAGYSTAELKFAYINSQEQRQVGHRSVRGTTSCLSIALTCWVYLSVRFCRSRTRFAISRASAISSSNTSTNSSWTRPRPKALFELRTLRTNHE